LPALGRAFVLGLCALPAFVGLAATEDLVYAPGVSAFFGRASVLPALGRSFVLIFGARPVAFIGPAAVEVLRIAVGRIAAARPSVDQLLVLLQVAEAAARPSVAQRLVVVCVVVERRCVAVAGTRPAMRPCSRCVAVADCPSAMRLAVDSVGSLWISGSDWPPASCSRQHDRCRYHVGSGAVAAAATGCCTTALLTERLLRAVDDGVRRLSPPDHTTRRRVGGRSPGVSMGRANGCV